MTDFRALCAELLQGLDENRHPEVRYPGHLRIIMARARAAIANPEPEGPSNDDLMATMDEAVTAFPPRHPEAEELCAVEYEIALQVRKARAVLARWGNHRGILGSSPQPVPVSERLPGPEDCDEERRCWLTTTETEPGWVMDYPERCTNWTHWLPFNALPLPSGEVSE